MLARTSMEMSHIYNGKKCLSHVVEDCCECSACRRPRPDIYRVLANQANDPSLCPAAPPARPALLLCTLLNAFSCSMPTVKTIPFV